MAGRLPGEKREKKGVTVNKKASSAGNSKSNNRSSIIISNSIMAPKKRNWPAEAPIFLKVT
jgi:hypothetical protein